MRRPWLRVFRPFFGHSAAALLAAALTLALALSCRRGSPPPPANTPAPPGGGDYESRVEAAAEAEAMARAAASAAAAEMEAGALGSGGRAAEVGLDALGLTDPDLHRDEPAAAGWETESVSAEAEAVLKKLAGLASPGNPSPPEGLSDLVTPEFRTTDLRPAELQTVFADAAFTVRRPAGKLPAEPGPGAGFPRLAEAFAALVEPATGWPEARASFKIFRTEVAGETARTTAHFEFSARDGGGGRGGLQVGADWVCGWERPGSPGADLRLASVRVDAYEEVVTQAGIDPAAESRFVDCTESILGKNTSWREQLGHGVDHWLGRIEQRFAFGPSGWQGLALGDVNGDGLDDLYAPQPGGLPNRLFVQGEDGRLTDVSRHARVDWWDHSHGALFADLDDDGDQDLVVGVIYGLILMANDGAGRFAVAGAKLFPEAMPYSLAAADFDLDGDIDLYACAYSLRGVAVENRFLARPIPYHDAENGGRNVLLRNDRNFRFRDVTKAVGLDENNRRFSFAASWEDYDNDGDPDLYVANDFGRNNLYRNEGGHFRDVAAEAGVEDISAGMSVAWGDVDRDGWMDLYVSNMWSTAGGRIAYQRQFQASAEAGTRGDFQRHARGNSLFLNAGDGTFRDVSVEAGVTRGRWAWGSATADLNNDAREDIVVANGYITQDALPGDL